MTKPLLFIAMLLSAGCTAPPPEGALVVTQVPVHARTPAPQSILDQRYPSGSRVVLVSPPFALSQVRILSKGLEAAGDPIISPDAQHVYFSGRATARSSWQIYCASLRGRSPKQVTSMDKGAMHPALAAAETLIFSAPVPKPGEKPGAPPALYSQKLGGSPQRLTFGSSAAVEPTVMGDGRILFVSAHASSIGCSSGPMLGLFTINNDGTELTRFALDHDGPSLVRRPRELSDGRVAFLSADQDTDAGFRAEAVRKARPFLTRTVLGGTPMPSCRSLEPAADGSILACMSLVPGVTGALGTTSVYRLSNQASAPAQLLLSDTSWDCVEAVPLSPRLSPMGHTSAIDAGKRTGTILCLNANFTRAAHDTNSGPAATQRVRVLAAQTPGSSRSLGEIKLQADGSFMAEVPADTPLGFETLDANGQVLQRLAPALWVRPGENRTCIGCHEPDNHSPRNVRPLAVTAPVAVLKRAPAMEDSR